MVLGFGLSRGQGVSVALLIAGIVENLPEGVGLAVDLEEPGMSRADRATVAERHRRSRAHGPIGRALGEASATP